MAKQDGGSGRRRWATPLAAVLLTLTTGGGLVAVNRQVPRKEPAPNTRSVYVAAADSACRILIDSARTVPPDTVKISKARACVASADSLRRVESWQALTGEVTRLALMHLQIPEFHDEQPLWDGQGGLGPLANIYASPYLGDFWAEWQIAEHGSQGVLAALVFVDGQAGDPVPATYDTLHLRAGMVNCVWLAYQPASSGGAWKASVTHADLERPCRPTATGARHPLSVRRRRLPGATAADYPPVARFSAAKDSQPLLGFKCLDAWCELGPMPGFVPDTPTTNISGPLGQIKGWHDEQDLAEYVGGRWVPRVHAAIVPAPKVDTLKPADFEKGPIPVATVVLSADPRHDSKYYRWGLRKGRNRVVLSHVGGTWSAKLLPGNGSAPRPWDFVRQMMHMDAVVPGTARFRWTKSDDGVWVPCGQSCCEVEGPFR